MEKTAVAGVMDRAASCITMQVVPSTDVSILQGFVRSYALEDAVVCTDERGACTGLGAELDHKAVNRSVGEYVRVMAHAQGIEAFWAVMKQARS